MLNIKDIFNQDNELLVNNSWDILAGLAEIIDHGVFCASGSPLVSQCVYSYHTSLDSAEQLVRARVKFDGVAGDPYVGLMVRVELLGNSPKILNRCYLVTLRHDGLVSVYSALSGGNTLLGTVTIDMTNADDASHNFIVKARDGNACYGSSRGTEILVFVDDEVSPVLTITDTRIKRPEGKYVGFDLFDGAANHQVCLTDFFAHVLKSAVIRQSQPNVLLKTFGDLIYEACFRVDRSGNSQFNTTQMGSFINYSLNELYNRLGYCKWWHSYLLFTAKAGIRFIETPAYVGLIYDIVDVANGRQMTKKTGQYLNTIDPLRSSSGTPFQYVETANGDNGANLAELSPVPAADTLCKIEYYWKPVPMVELTDVPRFPPEHNEILIFGALKRASQYDTSQKFYQTNLMSWKEALSDLLQARRQTMKGVERLTEANDLIRQKAVFGGGPVTRLDQLGF